AASDGWIATWGASPEPHPPVGPPRPSFADQTIRQVVRVSAGGHRVRIRLTNVFGATPLAVGAARVAMAATADSIEPATDRVLTFGGEKTVTIAPGTSMLSDPVDFDAPALSRVAISLYLPGPTGPCTCHTLSLDTGFLLPGNHVGDAVLNNATAFQQ